MTIIAAKQNGVAISTATLVFELLSMPPYRFVAVAPLTFDFEFSSALLWMVRIKKSILSSVSSSTIPKMFRNA